jgi:hypothetical protein
MSEIKLNLIDAQQILHGTIHGSVADSAVAALSAEPETLAELEAALARFIKPVSANGPFGLFHAGRKIDDTPWDAGIVIIDLAARIVAVESTYSMPAPAGDVPYHDGTQSTNVAVMYRVPEDWIFIYSIAEYPALRELRRKERAANPPLDARKVLYGRPLLEWIVETINSNEVAALRSVLIRQRPQPDDSEHTIETPAHSPDIASEQDSDTNLISVIHARWLMTPREDLGGQSPREVLFAKRDFVDFDLNSRELQWTFLDEGPPCLSVDSFAFRFAGFGTHEWVIYYDMVRHLLWSAVTSQSFAVDTESKSNPSQDIESAIVQLEEIKAAWLEQPHYNYDSKTPATLIENERKRLPIAMSPREMIVDENCPTCQMFANDPSFGVGFWHLDGCNMDDDFAFSYLRTREEWEAERLEWRAFSEKFNHEWEEKQQRIARGELVEGELGLSGVILDSDASISDSSDADDHGPHKVWGPRGWGAL